MALRPLPHMMKPKEILTDMTVEDTADAPLWEIMVPTMSNGGKPFSVRHHREWDEKVKAISGGMTLNSPVRGTWVDQGQTYTERVIPVRIMCTRAQIIEIAKETARHYDQIAVLAYRVSDTTVLVRNPHATALEAVVPECPRHGGPWGDDETCCDCTDENGQPRPLAEL